MQSTSIREGDLLWEPSEKVVKDANLSAYMQWLETEKGLRFDTYHRLWDWSVRWASTNSIRRAGCLWMMRLSQ